jgi:hypothetical protein
MCAAYCTHEVTYLIVTATIAVVIGVIAIVNIVKILCTKPKEDEDWWM